MGINKENSGVYVEGNVELKKVFEEGIHPLGEKPTIFLNKIRIAFYNLNWVFN